MTEVKPLGRDGAEGPVPDASVQSEMNAVAQNYLWMASIAVGVYYCLRGIGYLVKFPADTGPLLGGAALISSLCCMILFMVARKTKMAPLWVEASTFLVGALVIFNVFWNMYLTGDKTQLFSAGLAIVVFGISTSQLRVWLSLVGICIVCFLVAVVNLAIIGLNAASVLIACTLISAAAFFTRAPAIRRRIELQLELEDKADKLQAANMAKDHFLANMSHEIRTPMTGVLGMMDLLRDTKLSREQTELLDMAKTSADYLRAIINDILDYSKLESGKFELKPAAMDAVVVTRDVTEMLRAQAITKGVGLELTLPPDPALPVRGDALRIGQILFNLLGNAIKFTDEGHVSVSLAYERQDKGLMLDWRVRDSGVGISEEGIARLFNRFQQQDSSSTRIQSGTGLGLAIIRELLSLMGGEISVASEVGKGSEFRFTVLLSDASGDTIASDPDQHSNNAVVAPRLKVLVAEDNTINQMLIVQLLKRHDWDIHVVENGEMAVAAVIEAAEDGEPFDLVLMDVQMPVMDGVAAVREIKRRLADPPPVIALTANTLKSDVEAYLKAGMDAHVGKPIDRKDLLDTITQVLDADANLRAAV